MSDVHCAVLWVDFPVDKTHSVQLPMVLDPNRLVNFFDSIAYLKGSAVLRMIEDVMEEKKFDEGIREFLNKFLYRNVSSQDFFDVMAKHSDKPVVEILTGWTQACSYPLVSITKEAEGVFRVNQRAYDTNYSNIWPIFLKYITSDGTVNSLYFYSAEVFLYENVN